MKKYTKKLNSFDFMLNIFAWLSFFVAIAFAIMVIFSTVAGTDNGKVVFGHKLLIVESDSMSKSPASENESVFFSSGDIIIIKPVSDYATIQEGDVITFVSSNPDSVGQTLSHKVRSVKKNAVGSLIGFETYGIYTGVSDKAVVDPTMVIGEYVGKIENLGTLFKFFKTPAGYFLGILIPCLLLLIFFSIAVGKLLGRKEMADTFDVEIDRLKGRVDQLENMEGGTVVQTVSEEPAPASESLGRDQQLEWTMNALNRTIETLTNTIQNLAMTVTKPVDTLARTIEVLATAKVQNEAPSPEQEPPIEEVEPMDDPEESAEIEEIALIEVEEANEAEEVEAVEEAEEAVVALPVPRKVEPSRCGEYPKCKECPHHRKKLVRLFAPSKRFAHGDTCTKAKHCRKAMSESRK